MQQELDPLADYEDVLRQRLAVIVEKAKAEAAPIIAQLVELESLKPPRPMVILYREEKRA